MRASDALSMHVKGRCVRYQEHKLKKRALVSNLVKTSSKKLNGLTPEPNPLVEMTTRHLTNLAQMTEKQIETQIELICKDCPSPFDRTDLIKLRPTYVISKE